MSGAYLNGIPLSAMGNVAWMQTAGVVPYTAQFVVHRTQWDRVEPLLGTACTLKMVGLNGEIEVSDVYPLHTFPVNSPNRVGFVVADKRWMWPYKLVVRDYNITRKTGDKTMLREEGVPIELAQFVDRYKYLTYSLRNEKVRWKGRHVIEDVLTALEGKGNFEVGGVSLAESDGEEGSVSVQNLMLRDNGHNAMSRVLALIPGSQVTVDLDGTVRVFDGTDLDLTEAIKDDLGPIMQTGSYPYFIDRTAIRPKGFRVYTVREVEVRVDHQENYGGTVVAPDKDDPFIENVLPLPDVVTEGITLRDEERETYTVDAPQGTWAPVATALSKWEDIRQESGVSEGLPYSFEALRLMWFQGGLTAAWVGNGSDIIFDREETINAQSRVNAIQQHFRQTFRINPKYMARIREIKAVRAGLLDPITGARAPALAWQNYCVIPTVKGTQAMARSDDPEVGTAYNINTYPGKDEDLNITASQHRVSIIDSKMGIFGVSFVAGPYGMQGSASPGYCVNGAGSPTAMRRALRFQEDNPIAPGAYVAGVAPAFLGGEFNIAAVLTFTPNSPNDKSQLHVEEYTSEEIAKEFATLKGLEGGTGPVMEIFIPPSVCVARFGWSKTEECRKTVADLFGVLGEEDDVGLSQERAEMPGFVFVNGDDEIPANSKSAAAEYLMSYADTWSGNVETKPRPDIEMNGAISSMTHGVGPGGRVSSVTGFRGKQISVDRFALLPHPVRHITLGIIPYKADDR